MLAFFDLLFSGDDALALRIVTLKATPLASQRVGCSSPSGRAATHFRQLVEGRAERVSPGGQTIFDFRRNLMVDDSAHDAIGFHLSAVAVSASFCEI